MAAFDAAGIYTFIDLDTFNSTVVETAPAWTQTQFEAYAMVMDVFSKYDNMAGFYIGNEIINTVGDPTAAAPYIKVGLGQDKHVQDIFSHITGISGRLESISNQAELP
jgi:hypothetical protein